MKVQNRLVIALVILFNIIRSQAHMDSFQDDAVDLGADDQGSDDEEDDEEDVVPEINSAKRWRDSIAEHMWRDHLAERELRNI
jgi:hypothetical protein